MEDNNNLPANISRTALAARYEDLESFESQRDFMKQLLEVRFLKTFKSPEDAVFAAQIGKDLGLPIGVALNTLIEINGKITLPGKARWQLLSKMFDVKVIHDMQAIEIGKDVNGKPVHKVGTTIQITYMGKVTKVPETVKYTYFLEDAQKAGLTSKDVWVKYPRLMMLWKAATAISDLHFGWMFLGIADTATMADVSKVPYRVNDNGDIELE